MLVNIGVLLTFVNGFINDWYGFPESMMTLYIPAIVFAYGAVFFGKSQGIRRMLSFIFLALSYNSYPVAVGYYVFYSLLFAFLENHGCINKKSIRAVLFALTNVIIAVSGNIVLTKTVANKLERYSQLSIANIISNIDIVLSNFQATWLTSNNQLPPFLFLTVFLLLLGIAVYLILKFDKYSLYERIQCIISLSVILLGGVLCVYVPHLVVVPVWITNRTIVAMFCLFSVLSVMIAFFARNTRICRIAVVILGIFLIVNVHSIQNAAQEVFAANAIQQNMSLQIQAAIENFEEANQTQIEYVGFIDDKYPTKVYPFARQTFCEQIPNAYTISWNRLDCLNYYTNEKYIEIVPPESLKQQYQDKNWDIFLPEEHIIFDQNAAYIVVY